MLKQTVLAGLVTASLFASVYVMAEDADGTTTAPAAPQMNLNMNQEMNRLQNMIQVGERNGELTDSEIALLTQERDRLRLHESDMLKDGLSVAETTRLRTMLREHEYSIMGQRNNGERKQHQYQHQYQYEKQNQNQNGDGDAGQGKLQQQQAAPANGANGNGNLFQERANTQGQGNSGKKQSSGLGGGAFNFGGGSGGKGVAGGGAGRSGR